MRSAIIFLFIKKIFKLHSAKNISYTRRSIKTVFLILIITGFIVTTYFIIFFSSQNKVISPDLYLSFPIKQLFLHNEEQRVAGSIEKSSLTRLHYTTNSTGAPNELAANSTTSTPGVHKFFTSSPSQQSLHSTSTPTIPHSHIPQLFHQMNSETVLPAQFLISLSSVARYHRLAIDDRDAHSNESHTFQYYFWTDQSIREFVADCKASEPLCEHVDPSLAGVLLADVAYAVILVS